MKRRGRPEKIRYIFNNPKTVTFSPRGRPGRPNEVILRYEELEALKLIDLQGMRQEEAAGQMMISRQTFGRVLRKARKSISEALVYGKIIRITGGAYKISERSTLKDRE
jgi:predicted DNA-binding protein (UPF0251 family)